MLPDWSSRLSQMEESVGLLLSGAPLPADLQRADVCTKVPVSPVYVFYISTGVYVYVCTGLCVIHIHTLHTLTHFMNSCLAAHTFEIHTVAQRMVRHAAAAAESQKENRMPARVLNGNPAGPLCSLQPKGKCHSQQWCSTSYTVACQEAGCTLLTGASAACCTSLRLQ